VLSIQYVYERVFYFFACFSKRVQKYNLFFIWQVFLKFFLIFFLQFLIPIYFLNVALFAGRKGKSFI